MVLSLLNNTWCSYIKAFDSLYKSPFQPQNGLPFILTTLHGIIILVSESQHEKASFPIFVTLFGMLILISDPQDLKAPSPIFVTLFGILMLVSDVQP